MISVFHFEYEFEYLGQMDLRPYLLVEKKSDVYYKSNLPAESLSWATSTLSSSTIILSLDCVLPSLAPKSESTSRLTTTFSDMVI